MTENSPLEPATKTGLATDAPHLPGWTQGRRDNAARYDRLFAEAAIAGVTPPPRASEGHVYNQYTIRCERRDELAKHLSSQKIGNAIYYPLSLHQQACFAYLDHREGDFPVSEQAAREVLSLPIYAELGEARQRRVVESIAAFYR